MTAGHVSIGSLSNDDGYGKDKATKQEYHWLKMEKNHAARAARISVHFFAVVHKTTT